MLWKLREAGIGQRPVIFVGHSMGGLIIKQELVTSPANQKILTDETFFINVMHKSTLIMKQVHL